MEKSYNLTKYYPRILYIIFAVGVVLHLIRATLGLALALTPYLLLAINLITIYLLLRGQPISQRQRLFLWIVATYLVTLTVEIIGVQTGLIFGNYNYGSTLGWQLMGVPLIIGLNWVIVVLGALVVSSKYLANSLLIIPVAAAITVLFDFIMEPVAIKFDYWQWVGGAIPLQNYVAWFVLSLVAGILFTRLKLKVTNNFVIHLLFAQALFFAILNLF